MAESLDMSLDAIIEKNKKSGGGRGSSTFSRARGQGRGGRDISGPGPVRRFPNRVQTRRTPYFTTQVLFSEVGVLKRYSIHYDNSGRSKGTAEVVFARQSDAFAAVKKYNNVQLDGKPMKIEMV